ncbi:SpoIIAA-like protein [Rhodobacter sp. JA431]|uniref:STAS/SEC14 domain-containing protein n=1 Tax=Rhodobacter sp. JA431 TaxID=570013 RepID=UPI000BDD5B21|nr:STAS/SEC14 domain-containing protein [Rhodobacter sp. JA431]SOB93083.1 SpoIIAA-like protein [Rhodobacter sp. JA431]
MTKGRFTLLDGFPADVLAVEAHGRIDHDAYVEDLIPAVEERLAAAGRLKLLYALGADFEGFTAGAMFEDGKVGLLHLADFARIAVVSDVAWISAGVRLFAPLIRCPVRTFPRAEMAEARVWISADPERAGGPEVAADQKLMMLEDREPPAS